MFTESARSRLTNRADPHFISRRCVRLDLRAWRWDSAGRQPETERRSPQGSSVKIPATPIRASRLARLDGPWSLTV